MTRCCKTVQEAERRIREMRRVRETLNSLEEEKNDMENEARRKNTGRFMKEAVYDATTGERLDTYDWEGLDVRAEMRAEAAFSCGLFVVPVVKGEWWDYAECMDIETVMTCVPLRDIEHIVATHLGYYSDGGTCQNGTEFVMNDGSSIYVDLSWWSVMDLLRKDA